MFIWLSSLLEDFFFFSPLFKSPFPFCGRPISFRFFRHLYFFIFVKGLDCTPSFLESRSFVSSPSWAPWKPRSPPLSAAAPLWFASSLFSQDPPLSPVPHHHSNRIAPPPVLTRSTPEPISFWARYKPFTPLFRFCLFFIRRGLLFLISRLNQGGCRTSLCSPCHVFLDE